MRKLFLNYKSEDTYIKAPEVSADYTAVPVHEMKEIEEKLADQADHITRLQQIMREKSNRERKVRPVKSSSGYKVLSITIQPAFHLTERVKEKAYIVTLDTPWSLADMDIDTAQKMWDNDAVRLCQSYGLEYLPEGWKGKSTREWRENGYAFGGLPAADYVRRHEYTVSFISSKAPIIGEWSPPDPKKKAPQSK